MKQMPGMNGTLQGKRPEKALKSVEGPGQACSHVPSLTLGSPTGNSLSFRSDGWGSVARAMFREYTRAQGKPQGMVHRAASSRVAGVGQGQGLGLGRQSLNPCSATSQLALLC